MNQQKKRLRLIGLLVLCGLIFILAVAYRRHPSLIPCDSKYAKVYDVVIDAGSTGSRVHIFQFEHAKDGILLLSERYRRVEPGLSSYASYPEGVRTSLNHLLELAVEAVPASHYACTAVTLRATAGLRLLPEHQQNAVLEVAAETLSKSPFRSRGASIISGAQEGVYGWLTVNYLLGILDAEATAMTIDMGGASTQVVFETEKAAGEWLPFNYVHQLRTPRRSIALYQHSYLGLGLNEAKRTMLAAFAAANGTTSFPCFPTGYTQRHNGVELHNSEAADFEVCAEMLRAHVVQRPLCRFNSCGAHGIPQPLLSAAPPKIIYAFSYYYDRLHRFQDDDSPVTVLSFKEKGREACQRDSQSQTTGASETMCMDMAYLYTFLTQGIGLADSTPLHVPNRIDGKGVTWSLGASLSFLLRME